MGLLEDDLRQWIKALGYRMSKGADPRSAEIENLANQMEKAGAHAEAWWIRQRTSADYIRNTVNRCRDLIDSGEIEEAYRIHQDFELHRQHITALLDQHHIRRGRKVVRSAKAGHEAVHGTDTEKSARWKRIHEDYEAEKAKGTPKAALVIAERHGVSVRQVFRAKNYLSKID